MSRYRIPAIATVGLSATVWAYACGDGAMEPTPTPDPSRPTTVTVTPASAELTAIGATVQLAAQVLDQNGQVMAGAAVTWSSGATSVATVSAAGLVAAVGNGAATITAMAGSASGTASITVAQEVGAVTVTPAADTLLALGDTLRLSAEASDANGHVVEGTAFTWASADTLVAVVDSTGLVTGIEPGEVAVTATATGVSGHAVLTVVATVPTTVAVTPDTVAFTAIGQNVQLAAEVLDQARRVMKDVGVSWSSTDTAIAVVDSVGLVTAAGAGSTTVAATAGDVSAMAVVTVMQSAGSVVVMPVADTITPGDTLRLAAEAFDENEHPVDEAVFTWASNNPSVATVNASGLVRGIAEGSVTITATAGEASGTSEITVENPDRAVLVALYNATDGPNWVNNENWLSDRPLRDWYGVGTNGSGRVVWLDLRGRWDPENRQWIRHGLAGQIPPQLGNLANLTQLLLGENRLTGPIPPELRDLAKLTELDLGANQLTGPIPPQLGNLANLTRLLLDRNNLTGPIPPQLGNLANLTRLLLGENNLTGPIPPQLGNLSTLEALELQGNDVTGSMPSQLGNLTNLTMLRLGDNSLTGPIPSELGNLANLTWLELVMNGLTGPIPAALGTLAKLEYLELRQNSLTGPIPTELANLTNLYRLELERNALTGPIPLAFLSLDQLEYFTAADENDLCVSDASAFANWLQGISYHDLVGVTSCNAADIAALEALYRATGGGGWTKSDGWLSDRDVEEWYGVSADSLGRVTELDLARNGLRGQLPTRLGGLTELTVLRIGRNGLSGHLPLTLTRLSLRELHYVGTELCAPTEASFQTWLNGVSSHEGTGRACAPLSDRDFLQVFFEESGGTDWTNNNNWLTDAPLGRWHGVTVDPEGRVVRLSLRSNNLTGSIAPEFGNLVSLETLSLWDNNLTGPIPPALGNLASLSELSLWDNNLTGPIPPALGNLASLSELSLGDNNLTGPIPPALGNLASLSELSLGDNNLTGPIPSEFGNLASLETLSLGRNDLTGPIPSQLGNLSNLTWLDLGDNDLAGPIPPQLGNLSNLTWLDLGDNDFAGPIPPQLGDLSTLEALELANNDLTGGVPSEIGGVASLEALSVAHNTAMSGALPAALTDLSRLTALLASGTGLCAPSDADFQTWLEGVYKSRIKPCIKEGPPAAYLTQAVQSREFPVPLVAGERALLRVFPTASQATNAGFPLVRGHFYRSGRETHVVDIPGKPNPIPTTVREGRLTMSANTEIPAHVIQPGLEMVLEVDPDGTMDSALGVAKRIPAEGRLAVEVRAMPLFDLTLIPFIWTQTQDSSIVELVAAIAADPENHQMLVETRTLLPIGDLEVTPHEPVLSSSNNAYTLLSQTAAIRVMEGGAGHYMGMISPPLTGPTGLAHRSGRLSFSQPSGGTMAHELGHNLSLAHAPCGGAGNPDPSFPYSDGSIGAWGYDFDGGGRLVAESRLDLMSYCGPSWISDYHFTNALRYRLVDDARPGAAALTASTQSVLLWGGVGADGVPYLEPAFVVEAPSALPDSAGEYRITGQADTGANLFSLSFAMPETADGVGSSGFAFALPVRAGWENSLATITLTGPGGSATLDGESDQPMSILRNLRNGQVRGILRNLPPPSQATMDQAGRAAGPGLEVLFSRGIPGAAAWRR